MPDIINSGSIVFRLATYFSVSSEAMRYLGLIPVPEVYRDRNSIYRIRPRYLIASDEIEKYAASRNIIDPELIIL